LKDNSGKCSFSFNVNWTNLVYIRDVDTCLPSLLVKQVSTTGMSDQFVPPVLKLPVALLRLPGVPPPRPAPVLIPDCGHAIKIDGLFLAKQ
jgi:hypothetical protein